MLKATRDPWIVEALHTGRITTDPDSGLVFRNGKRAEGVNVGGYIAVPLGQRRAALAHRIIWIAEHGQPEDPTLQINHRNRVRHDNRLINLELVTPAENVAHALGSAYYERVRPEDEQAVDPAWLALVQATSESGNVTRATINALRGRDEPSASHLSPYGRRPERLFTGTRQTAHSTVRRWVKP